MIPGEVVHGDGEIEINAGLEVTRLTVVNTADRPVQVGSHYHFAEANPGLEFERAAAWGKRLAIPAGTSVRFEPGAAREVELVKLGGARIVPGLRGECGGELDAVGVDGGELDSVGADGGELDSVGADGGELDDSVAHSSGELDLPGETRERRVAA